MNQPTLDVSMHLVKKVLLAVVLATVALAQSPEPPLTDTRLTIHTLVREDVFAGLLTDDMARLARAERNIQSLLEKRPAERPDLLAWQAGATLYRAVRAYEDKRADEFQAKYQQALDLIAQARQKHPAHPGVAAVVGGSYVLLADRLPKERQAAAWATAYDSFQVLWKFQGGIVDKLPVHIRGELLGGLAQSAQRTGRTAEVTQHLDRILTVLSGTPYEAVAKRWKANPKAAESSSITCLTCHEPGRLAARLASLNNK
jgi:hypothetical protein